VEVKGMSDFLKPMSSN